MNDINYSNLSLVDNEARVFKKKDIFYRGIFSEKSSILSLLKTGLFQEFVNNNLLPKSEICDVKIDGFHSIIKHETALHVTYPHEWSLYMLKDACLMYLHLYKKCLENGYSLKDGHGYNIVFFGTIPKFVDLGSIQKGEIKNIQEFNKTMLLPLMIWLNGNYNLANKYINDDVYNYSLKDIYNSLLGQKFFNKGKKAFLSNLISIKKINKFCFSNDIEDKITYLQNIQENKINSTWNNYHQCYFKDDKLESTERFDALTEIVKNLEITSLYDVACNEGLFSLLVSERCKKVKKIIATDYDFNAINNFYNFLKLNPKYNNISIGISNCIIPNQNFQEDAVKERFKSDCVVVLALTHHLILGQGFHLDNIVKRFYDFTNKYLLIEFMPLGLWGGEDHENPSIPDFYTEDWFANALSVKFKITSKVDLEKNRICFVCEKKS